MLQKAKSAPNRIENSPSKAAHFRLPQKSSEEIGVDDNLLELRPDLPLRPLTLRFSLAYYASAVLTSLPLLFADFFGVLLANAAGVAIATSIGGAGITVLPVTLLLMQPLIGLFLGLLPGVGLSSAEEVRRTSAATTIWALPLLCLGYVKFGEHSAAIGGAGSHVAPGPRHGAHPAMARPIRSQPTTLVGPGGDHFRGRTRRRRGLQPTPGQSHAGITSGRDH